MRMALCVVAEPGMLLRRCLSKGRGVGQDLGRDW